MYKQETHTEAPDTTGCDGMAVRPMIAMAGRVTSAFAVENENYPNDTPYPAHVQVWIQSPTGGESDSCIFVMDCNTMDQAQMIASQWQIRWAV